MPFPLDYRGKEGDRRELNPPKQGHNLSASPDAHDHHEAGEQGLEPRYLGPEPSVLPLDDSPILDRLAHHHADEEPSYDPIYKAGNPAQKGLDHPLGKITKESAEDGGLEPHTLAGTHWLATRSRTVPRSSSKEGPRRPGISLRMLSLLFAFGEASQGFLSSWTTPLHPVGLVGLAPKTTSPAPLGPTTLVMCHEILLVPPPAA